MAPTNPPITSPASTSTPKPTLTSTPTLTSKPTNPTTTTFLTLPPEIRQLIYHHCIPTSRLTPFPLGDAEWSMQPPNSPRTTRNPPPFIFSSRTIYAEASAIFYSRATLEVAPAQQGNNWFNIKFRTKVISHAYSRLISTFRFYNPAHLRLIRNAHVYSNQIDVIDGECYEALLQWLVEYTGVVDVHVSSRPMTRIRGKAGFDLEAWRGVFASANHTDTDTDADFGADVVDGGGCSGMRIVRVWTKANRPPWEYEKMMRLHCLVSNGTLVPMQIYFWSPLATASAAMRGDRGESDDNADDVTQNHNQQQQQQQLQLDPRWLTKRHDDEDKIRMTAEAARLIDALIGRILHGQELLDYRNNSRHFSGESWVYQMIVVAES